MLDAEHIKTKRTFGGEVVDVYRLEGGALFYFPDVRAWSEHRELLDFRRKLGREPQEGV
jgi:hypothetical protein